MMSLLAPEPTRASLGGLPVDLVTRETADEHFRSALRGERPPTWFASANLNKITSFGEGGPYAGVLSGDAWVVLLDGSPLVAAAKRVTGHRWPRLAGSDLLPGWLDIASEEGATIGVIGSSPSTHETFSATCATRWPGVRIATMLSPTPEEATDPVWCEKAAEDLDAAGVDLLLLALSDSRMERWASSWGTRSGCRVILCFGAAIDFITADQRRAPEWVRTLGIEWLWRLALSPRRLARRYLVEGPSAWWTLRRSSYAAEPHR